MAESELSVARKSGVGRAVKESGIRDWQSDEHSFAPYTLRGSSDYYDFFLPGHILRQLLPWPTSACPTIFD